MKYEPTLQEIHTKLGDPFQLEIGTWTMDGYTGDSIYWLGGKPKDRFDIHVDYYYDKNGNKNLEMHVDVISYYRLIAKKRKLLAEVIEALGKYHHITYDNTMKDRYIVNFVFSINSEEDMQEAVDLSKKIISLEKVI